MNTQALFSSSKDDWRTPQCVLERVRKVDRIYLDPCPDEEDQWWTKPLEIAHRPEEDGLLLNWNVDGLVYVNPPYSKMQKWVTKAVNEASQGAEVVLLVPARVETRWFADLWDYADALCFWRSRLRFEGAKNSAPFPSTVVYFGRRVRRFETAFKDVGKVIRL